MQVVTEVADESSFRARTGQKASIGGERIEESKEAEAVNEVADKAVNRDHAFGLEFAEWDMNRPLIWPHHAETVPGQIGTFSDAHAGMANEQKGIAAQIVTPQELLPEKLVLVCGERAGESLR